VPGLSYLQPSSPASVAVQQSLLGQQAPTQPAIAYLGTLYLAKHLWHEPSLSNKRSLPAPPIDLSADEEQPAQVAGKAPSDGGERGHGPARRVGEGNSDDDNVQYLSSSDGDELPTNRPGKGREDALGVAANNVTVIVRCVQGRLLRGDRIVPARQELRDYPGSGDVHALCSFKSAATDDPLPLHRFFYFHA
jgi:hypothetical protein